jgi:hypothetical protein
MSLIWKYNNQYIFEPVYMGELEELETSSEKSIIIKHDFALPIKDCGVYISSYSGDYVGSLSPLKDYEQILWYANNYSNYGLELTQSYIAYGQIEDYSGLRLIDLDRVEETDIFTGQTLEILDGLSVGETSIIDNYDPINKLITLLTPFTNDVTNANYKIGVEDHKFFKTGVGSSKDYPILLLNKAGTIDRNEEVELKLIFKVPKFARNAANLLVNFNMNYTSTEET